MPGEDKAKRRARKLTRNHVDRSTVRAGDLVGDVESQSETCTLVRICFGLGIDSTSQRIKYGASLPLRNGRPAIKDANGDGVRLVAVESDVDGGAA